MSRARETANFDPSLLADDEVSLDKLGTSGTLDVSSATLTTSTAQKEAIVQAGPGSGTIDVSSGTFTTSTAQKQAIVQAGPGSGAFDVSSGTLTTSTPQKQAIVDGATIEAQDLASGSGTSLPNNVQDAITRLGNVTSGTFNGTIGASATNNLQDYVFVTLPSNQSVSHATITAINLTSETDPNGWFDTTTFKFQPDVAGKYFISLTATGSSGTSAGYLEEIKIAVKKNDNSANYTGAVLTARVNEQSARGYVEAVCAAGIVDLNGSSDYLYNVVYGQMYFGSGTLDLYQDSVHFSAIRIGS